MDKSESKYFNTARKMDEALIALLEKKDLEFISVKEICSLAGVSRSTFYLHYETISDLLSETAEYLTRECFETMAREGATLGNISEAPLESLNLITPTYLIPYLSFIQTHQSAFRAAITNPSVLNAEKTFAKMFKDVIGPILSRFEVPEKKQPYILDFYIRGMIAIIERWVREGCKESPEYISEVIIQCVRVPL